MDTAIRVGLILLAVASIIAAVSALVPIIVNGLVEVIPYFVNAINSLTPYLLFGKRLFNNFIGNGTLANVVLILAITMPITYFITTIVVRVYRLIIGQ